MLSLFLFSTFPMAVMGELLACPGGHDPTLPVTGVVITETGDPIEGVTVEYEESINAEGERLDTWPKTTTTTDASGRFSFSAATCGGLIRAEADDFTRALGSWPSRTGEMISLTLFPPATLHGRFESIPDKRDAHIRYALHSDSLQSSRISLDENGEFTLSNLRPGRLVLRITSWGDNFQPLEYEFMIASGEEKSIVIPAIKLPLPFDRNALVTWASEMGHYINNDWRNDNEQSKRAKIISFLGKLDALSMGKGKTARKLSEVLETTLFNGWNDEELREEIVDQIGVRDLLYQLSSIYLDEYESSSPLQNEHTLINIFFEEEPVGKSLIALTTFIEEKDGQNFFLSLVGDIDLTIAEAAFERGARRGVSDLQLGGAVLCFIFLYVTN